MSSREEIEKAKERIKYICDKSLNNISYDHMLTTLELHYLRLLSQHIDQLEADNYELNNRLNEYIEDNKKQIKMIDEMAKFILKITNREESELNIEREKQYFRKKVDEKVESKDFLHNGGRK